MTRMGFAHTTHAYGIDPKHSAFTSRKVQNYRNYGVGLNLNAQFYSH